LNADAPKKEATMGCVPIASVDPRGCGCHGKRLAETPTLHKLRFRSSRL
jgi:hypothetical protein